jgi:prepilin signal peptidase PulO-like enzyme (type II secretory pathway)
VAATAGLFALAGAQYGGESAWQLALAAAYISVFIICTGTDVFAYRVPNVVTYPAVALALAVGMIAPEANRLDVAAGGLVVGGTFFAMAVATGGRGMGMGDVKLALFVGFALGLSIGIKALLVTALAGGAFALLLMVVRIRKRQDIMPYGPFISFGAVTMLLLQGAAFGTLGN